MELFFASSASDLGTFALGLVLAGAVGGLVAGMLGVGGGIVIVPVLYHVLGLVGIDEGVRMHIAVGTSLATIIPTSISSLRAHSKKGAVDRELLKRWAVPMILGVAIASVIGANLRGQWLAVIFACVALPVALHMALWGEKKRIADHLPTAPTGLLLPFGIGGLSTLMGIGGGTLGVPTMTLCGVPIHRAVGTASAFGAIIAIPGTIGAILGGWGMTNLPPWSVGFVNLLGFILIAPASFFMAPIGANLAHSIEKQRLRAVFALFIAITAGRMLWDALS